MPSQGFSSYFFHIIENITIELIVCLNIKYIILEKIENKIPVKIKNYSVNMNLRMINQLHNIWKLLPTNRALFIASLIHWLF